jgi:hypothetical protein
VQNNESFLYIKLGRFASELLSGRVLTQHIKQNNSLREYFAVIPHRAFPAVKQWVHASSQWTQ